VHKLIFDVSELPWMAVVLRSRGSQRVLPTQGDLP